ncbi:MAG TPA: hypothetical protein PLO61_00150 [Fimbriimonadaceae bacterium]|nr:hypothetical protein [Fimbriimonadaceae bacterium]HRJ33508.1 hypothetical protein [Fimbriimonadaceae bacterium]
MVQVGDQVEPNTPVARAMLPGILQTIKLADKLGVEAKDAKGFFNMQIGDPITKGQLIAETKGLFGWFKSKVESDVSGTIEGFTELTGHILVREPSIPVEIAAYIQGSIVEVMPEEGAIVETRGAMVQGIFGVGGERTGKIRIATSRADEMLDASKILPDDEGKILVGGSGITADAIQKASDLKVTGLIVGGVRDVDLMNFLGYDIGVAITGSEDISFTLLVTEGFGELAMADRTFELLKSLDGEMASINGATQIRAGVIRPELVVPLTMSGEQAHAPAKALELGIGTPIRIIREPYFGKLGAVTELPATLQVLESGTEVRVLMAKLADGEIVCVPRANVEIIAT